MKASEFRKLIREEVKTILKEEGSYLMKDPAIRQKVEMVIKTLKDIEVDGETMQHILEKVGMHEQMLHQLTSSGIR